jgi:hypothetical protein
MFCCCSHFLQAAVDYGSCWKLIHPHVEFLLRDVCFVLFRLSDEELVQAEHDPSEYIRRTTDVFKTHVEPRSAADLFLYALVKHRKTHATPIIDKVIAEFLATYNAAAPQQKDYIGKEVILYTIQSLSSTYFTDKAHRKFVEAMLVTHVTTEFASPVSVLRARAISTWASFASFKFRAQGNVHTALYAVVKSLDDPSLVVRTVAGGSINYFLIHNKSCRDIMQPYLVHVLQRLFQMLEEIGVDDVVKTVQTMLQVYESHLPTIVMPIMSKLVQIFEDIVPPVALGPDGVPLTIEDCDDESSLAAEGLLEAISAVLNILHGGGHTDTLKSILHLVWPLVDRLFVNEGRTLEFLHEAFELFGDIIVALDDDAPTYPQVWSIYSRMMHTYMDCGLDYTHDLLYPVDALMSYAPDLFTSTDPATGMDPTGLLCQAATVVEQRADERERGWMTNIMMSLMHFCRGKVDRFVPGIVSMYSTGIIRAHTVSNECDTTVVASVFPLFDDILCLRRVLLNH